MDDLEWQLEQARWNLEYWDRKYAEAHKAVRKATIRLVLIALVLIAQWTLARQIELPIFLALAIPLQIVMWAWAFYWCRTRPLPDDEESVALDLVMTFAFWWTAIPAHVGVEPLRDRPKIDVAQRSLELERECGLVFNDAGWMWPGYWREVDSTVPKGVKLLCPETKDRPLRAVPGDEYTVSRYGWRPLSDEEILQQRGA